MNKKAQFGPDAVVITVLVLMLGGGGIFFLNTFINGLALHGIISVLDSEIDQRCFFILLPLVGDEYSRAGDNVTNVQPFDNMSNYFGGESEYSYVSAEFNNTINYFKAEITNPNHHFIVNISYIGGYIATETKAAELRNETLAEMTAPPYNAVLTHFCSLPVYSPAGKVGTAELLLSEK